MKTIVTIAVPPGSHPKNAFDRFTRRFGVLLSARIEPANVNSGMASNAGADARRFISIIIATGEISTAENARIAIKPIIAKSGVPTSAMRIMPRIIRIVIPCPARIVCLCIV